MRSSSIANLRNTQVRKLFGRLKDAVPVPNLIGVQSKSYNDFAQFDYLPAEREKVGLEKVLRDIFPIDYEGKFSLEYVSYELGDWECTCGKLTGIANRYSWACSSCKKSGASRLPQDLSCPSCSKKTARYKTCSNCLSRVTIKLPMGLDECRSSGQTFALPLKIVIQLIAWDQDADGNRSVRDIKEQEVFFADVPIMADLYEEDGRFKLGSQATFLINGVDRVVVSQMHRSPGVVFSRSKKAKDLRGKPHYLGRIIPMRGSWLDFEFDSNDLLYARIDKKKKLLVTSFLQALGIEREKILSLFYSSYNITGKKGVYTRPVDDTLLNVRIEKGVLPEKLEKLYVGRRVTPEILKRLHKEKVKSLTLASDTALLNRVVYADIVHPTTGELIAEQGESITQEMLEQLNKIKEITFSLIATPGYVLQPTMASTLRHDQAYSEQEALKELHGKVWPGDSSPLKDVAERLHKMFFDPRVYDLTRVGRIRINRKLNLDIPEAETALTLDDIVASIRYLVNLRELGQGELDDIDHLGNRRVRLVGELLANQLHIGFARIERIVKERFRIQELHGALMPQDLLNVKPLSAVLREFFGSGQLSQFMDQTNPLSEIAHKRRLSALGPGGVIKDRATFEVRDVHSSHYGRICPIETPEGQTIGLISSLATYALVNDLGFIETAVHPVKDGKIQDEVVFLDAFQELNTYIAQADASDGKKIKNELVLARHGGNFMFVDVSKVDYIDVSPKQLVSVAAASVPFLEHDDASRALMGANMQRQAVPLIKCQAPLVGTGMEAEICKAAGAGILAKRSGIVRYVSAEKIIIQADEESFAAIDDWVAQGIDTYHLRKFQRSSYRTWIHQKPIIKRGDYIKKGQFITDGSATESNEIALGTNLMVAYMPWQGYNFEDAIVLNKRLLAEDLLTSVHIEEYVVDARDTKLGPEEITKDVPNVGEEALSSLDDDGIIRVGARVQPGDILVGKVTLKGDVQYSPEEKLLRAIFGEKAREVKDTSLRVPPGIDGTVIDVKIFSRSGIRKDKRYREEVMKQIALVDQEFEAHEKFLREMVRDKAVAMLVGKKPKGASSTIKALLGRGAYDADKLSQKTVDAVLALRTTEDEVNSEILGLKKLLENQLRILVGLKEERIKRLKKGDVLPSGVIKVVKVYISSKRPIQVGDKLAVRHGNKGIVSTIVPREDMPHLEDGTPVDIVFNPLGVPSRMNVGQILETALGLAGKRLGQKLGDLIVQEGYKQVKKFLEHYFGSEFIANYEAQAGQEGVMELARKTAASGVHFASPVFDGARLEQDIQPLLQEVGAPVTGSIRLRDGRTGEYFDQLGTVGSIYTMKLVHMVDDKLHARSVGPYSLVTQQPLGGKAQFGGQRFGEMEVWALEAYGAAFALQEMLTYKSDDVTGRHRVYEAIIRGDDIPDPGLPESFNVLIKELQSLGLQVDLLKSGREEVSE